MSDEGRDYVKRYSPFTGTTFWVHYVMGDIANRQHHYEIFIGDKRMADEWPFSQRAIQRARAELVEAGFLTVLDDQTSPGKSVKYRFEFPAVGKNGRQSGECSAGNGRQSGGERSPKSESSPITNRRRTKESAQPRERDLMFEALCEISGIDWTRATRTELGPVNKAKGQLTDVGATPDRVKAAAVRYKREWPNATLSATALAKHWTRFDRPETDHDPSPTKLTPEQQAEMDRKCNAAWTDYEREGVWTHPKTGEMVSGIPEALGVPDRRGQNPPVAPVRPPVAPQNVDVAVGRGGP